MHGEILGISRSIFFFLRGSLRLLESNLYWVNYYVVSDSHFKLSRLENVGTFMLTSSFTCRNKLDEDDLNSYDLLLLYFYHSSNSWSSSALKLAIGILHTRENIKLK